MYLIFVLFSALSLAELDPEKSMKDARHLYYFKDLDLNPEKEDGNKKLGTYKNTHKKKPPKERYHFLLLLWLNRGDGCCQDGDGAPCTGQQGTHPRVPSGRPRWFL